MSDVTPEVELSRLASIPVRRMGKKGCLVLGEEDSANVAVARLSEERRGAAVVVDVDGRVCGIFTERDVLVRSLGDDPNWRAKPLSEVMTPAPVTVHEDDSIADALAKMREGHFRHLPVVDGEGRPLATISIRTVLHYVAEHFPGEVHNLPPAPALEPRRLYGG